MAKLCFYYSAMNAGKSTMLLQSAHNYEERGLNVMLFTPALDDREGVGEITSRIGVSRRANMFTTDDDLYVIVRDAVRTKPIHCIMLDEAQFLTAKQVLQLTIICDQLNISVAAYGIRTDFRGEPFEGSKYLLSWAEELHEIKTVCHSGNKATMNARLDDAGNRVWHGQQMDVGHHYVSLSRKAFELPKVSPVGYTPPPDAQVNGQMASPVPAVAAKRIITSAKSGDGTTKPRRPAPR